MFPDGVHFGKWGVVTPAVYTPRYAGMRFVRGRVNVVEHGAASLVASAGQLTVPLLEAAVEMMGSRFVGTAAKFEAMVVHGVSDMGSLKLLLAKYVVPLRLA